MKRFRKHLRKTISSDWMWYGGRGGLVKESRSESLAGWMTVFMKIGSKGARRFLREYEEFSCEHVYML